MKKVEIAGLTIEIENKDRFTITSNEPSLLKMVKFVDGESEATWKDGSVTRTVEGVLNSVKAWNASFFSGKGFDLWPVGIKTEYGSVNFV